MNHIYNAESLTTDALLRECSAFSSLDDFSRSVSDNGYIPTLVCKPLRNVTPGQRSYQAKINVLAHRLAGMGFKVYSSRRYRRQGPYLNYA